VLFLATVAGTISLQSCRKDPTLPVLTTGQATEVTVSSAGLNGKITDDGGAVVTARGFCWGTEADPSLDDEFTPSGTGTGEFIATINELEPNTRYHARAYAENSVGIAYGNDVEFVTSTAPPAVTTGPVSNIAALTASSGGNITYDGGATITSKGVCWSTSPLPDISDPHTSDGTGSGIFTSTIPNLNPATLYYLRAYASNGSWTVYGEEVSFRTKLSDIEGNLYNTVVIGTQTWMAENLRTTKYNNSAQIPNITDPTAWMNLTADGYCWYNNNVNNKPTYGALYRWYTIKAGALCPTGWHVPTDAEFNTLEMFLGLEPAQVDVWGWRGTDQGSQIKSSTGWDGGGNGTNSSGFNGLPGGYRAAASGAFYTMGSLTYWWTATEHDAVRGWYRRVDGTNNDIYKASTSKNGGKYIRCVKD